LDDRDFDLLRSIAENAMVAVGYAAELGSSWDRDVKTVDAVSKRIEQVGELAKRLTPDALDRLGVIDWNGVKGMRDILAHDYADVDMRIVRRAIRQELPALVTAIESLLPGDRP
jgi:uncharacterized protein with HEPN domain